MRRTLPWTLLAGLLAAACAREHGDAPAGQFAPGGPIDQRGNAATTRALGGTPPGRGEPGDGPRGGMDPARLADQQDAGALDSGVIDGQVQGRVAAVGEERVRIVSERGQPFDLSLEEAAVTLGGTLISSADLRQGAEVRATFRTTRGDQRATDIEVLATPDAGPGFFQEALTPPEDGSPDR